MQTTNTTPNTVKDTLEGFYEIVQAVSEINYEAARYLRDVVVDPEEQERISFIPCNEIGRAFLWYKTEEWYDFFITNAMKIHNKVMYGK